MPATPIFVYIARLTWYLLLWTTLAVYLSKPPTLLLDKSKISKPNTHAIFAYFTEIMRHAYALGFKA